MGDQSSDDEPLPTTAIHAGIGQSDSDMSEEEGQGSFNFRSAGPPVPSAQDSCAQKLSSAVDGIYLWLAVCIFNKVSNILQLEMYDFFFTLTGSFLILRRSGSRLCLEQGPWHHEGAYQHAHQPQTNLLR